MKNLGQFVFKGVFPKNIFLVGLLLSTLVACTTKPVQENVNFKQAEWETKAQVRDLQRDKNNNISIDMLAIKDDKARLEVTAVLGYAVATAVITKEEFKCALITQKRFYYGRSTEDALAPLLKIPIHPMSLIRIAFDQPITGAGWACKRDRTGQLEQCENKGLKVVVKWYEREGLSKKVLLASPQFEMTWIFPEPQTNVQITPESFRLDAPESFKKIRLN